MNDTVRAKVSGTGWFCIQNPQTGEWKPVYKLSEAQLKDYFDTLMSMGLLQKPKKEH